MKHVFGLIVYFVFLTSASAGIEVDRVWSKGDYGYALVTYTNNSKNTFQKAATIQCIALDATKKKINTNTRSFFAHEYGPITPNFNGTVEIPIELNGFSMKSVSCTYRER